MCTGTNFPGGSTKNYAQARVRSILKEPDEIEVPRLLDLNKIIEDKNRNKEGNTTASTTLSAGKIFIINSLNDLNK